MLRPSALCALLVLTACSSEDANNLQPVADQQEATENAVVTDIIINNGVASDNTSTDDLITTPSGLQYKVLRTAEGPKPSATSSVTVNYTGTFTDGTVFDSSYSRGMPATFPLEGVIIGWTEGVQLMSVGSQYQFVIPPHLAYGEAGQNSIPPNSTLIFDIELIEINSM